MPINKLNYDIRINSQGYILAPSPQAPARIMERGPLYESRFAQGDRSYTDFSFFWFWAMTDWSGGLKVDPQWENDAKFYRTRNVDIFYSGQVRLLPKPGAAKDLSTFGAVTANSKVCAALTMNRSGTVYIIMAVGGKAAIQPAWAYSTDNFSSGASAAHTDAAGNAIQDAVEYKNEAYLICTGSALRPIWGIFGAELVTQFAATPVTVTEPTAIGASSTDIFVGSGVTAGGVSRIYNSTAASGSLQNSFTQVGSDLPSGYRPRDIIVVARKAYVFIERGSSGDIELRLYDAGASSETRIYEWKNYQTGVASRYEGRSMIWDGGNQIYIVLKNIGTTTGTNVIEVWKYNISTGVMSRVYQDLNGFLATSTGWTKWGDKFVLDNLILNPIDDVMSNGLRNSADDGTAFPMESRAGNLYTIKNTSDAGTDVNVYLHTAGTYYSSGFIDTSVFSEFPTIDKQWYYIDMIHDALAAGEVLAVSYSTDSGANFTSMDSSAVDNETSKRIPFSSPLTAKNLMLRYTFTAGTSDATTPKLRDFSAAYLPLPDYSHQWKFNIKVIDAMQLKDKQTIEPKNSRHLRNILWDLLYNKTAVNLEDVDYGAFQLNDAAFTAASATITVDEDTDNLPDQGIVKIENEFIKYTGKTKTTLTGLTRGHRNTVAVAHADNTAVHYGIYRVIITDITEKLIVSQDPQRQEWIITLTLREV